MEYKIGVAVGLVTGLAVGAFCLMLLFKKRILDMTFDERQKRVRGEAYKYGFWTLLGCLFAYSVLEMLIGHWCDTLTGIVLCWCVAMTVFAIVCITKDAYLSLREKPRTVMMLFAMIALMNFAIGGRYLLSGGLVENGILTFRAVNLICGVMMLVILAVYLVNYLMSGREDTE